MIYRGAALLLVTLIVAVVLMLEQRRQGGDGGKRPSAIVVAVDRTGRAFVDGRLSGGFGSTSMLGVTRGTASKPLPAELLAVAAAVQERAMRTGDLADRAALGVSWLIVGSVGEAINTLEDCASEKSDQPDVLNDLAVAYLTRGRQDDSIEDVVRALSLAARALRVDPRHREARFNRAVSLENLLLLDPSLAAWQAVLESEISDEWQEEALRRIDRIGRRQPASVDMQAIREQIEDVVLPRWGAALASGNTSGAAAALAEAAQLANQLRAASADAMAQREIDRIRALEGQDRSLELAALGRGFVKYGGARQAFLADQQERAAQLMDDAAGEFRLAGSLYALWAPVYRSIFLRNEGSLATALSELAGVDLTRVPEDFHSLRGRLDWARSVAISAAGDFSTARAHLETATAHYRKAQEADNSAATQTFLAEADWVLGNRSSGWANLREVLKTLDARGSTRRNYHLTIAANLAAAAGLPESVLEFESARISITTRARSLAEAYVNRARVWMQVGDTEAAERDLSAAEQAVGRLEDAALRTRNAADIRIVRAQLSRDIEPASAIAFAEEALTYVTRATPATRLAPLLMLRASSRERLNDFDGAESDLRAAIAAFEGKRAALATAPERMLAFQQERTAYKQLIALYVRSRRDPTAALRVALRSREGVTTAERDRENRAIEIPTQRLPRDVAIVHYELIDEELLSWVIQQDGIAFERRSVAAAQLSSAIQSLNRAIAGGASYGKLRAKARFLSSVLLDPILAHVPAGKRLVFVPDGPIHDVALAILPDPSGEPLVATRVVGIAKSLNSFLSASEQLRSFTAAEILAVGDGHDPSLSRLPRLPMADDEARAVGELYPRRLVLTGAAAGRAQLLREGTSVVHFAGHTIVNREFPFLSRLLLAPAAPGDHGLLFASQILDHSFRKTHVVVLASCEAASGTAVAGEGLISVASAFHAAGVPAVVAGLWPVEDRLAHDFFISFHRELRERLDAAAALRVAQLQLLATLGDNAPVSAWAGFIAMGGIGPRHRTGE